MLRPTRSLGFSWQIESCANTRAAVADFQARHGLELDAEVGPETTERLHVARGFSGRGRPRGEEEV
jgi:Putative peptidoglycan binding domain